MEQETITIKFDGQNHQVDLQTFANSVLNFATVIKETNKALEGGPVSIDIKAPERGSLLVQLVTSVATEAPSLLQAANVSYVANVVTVVGGLYVLHKETAGKKIIERSTDNGKVRISLEDGSTLTVAENVYNIYSSHPLIPTAISQNFSALDNDPAVTKFEVIREKGEKIVEVEKEDYARLSIKQQVESENTKKITESVELLVYKLVFDKTDRKWEFVYRGNRISANISDEEFYKRIDAGEAFAKGDKLQVDLQITQCHDETIGAYINQSYQILKVHEHIRREVPPELPFNKSIRG